MVDVIIVKIYLSWFKCMKREYVIRGIGERGCNLLIH